VTTLEFPGLDEPELDAPGTSMEELRSQALRLAAELPGTLRRLTLRSGALTVDVEWEGAPPPAPVLAGPAYPVPYPAGYPQPGFPPYPTDLLAPGGAIAPPAASNSEVTTATANSVPATNSVPVTAPLVGTFYRSASPGAEPFVKVGDVVEAGQTLAIIEAMKLLNNITAEHTARVVAIHAANGDIVEFAQPLMDLEPVE